jgi:AraC-like DNA-binding protein
VLYARSNGEACVRVIRSALPRMELRPFVRIYALREIRCGEEIAQQNNVATLEQPLSFHLNGQTFFDYPDRPSQLSPKVIAFGSTTYPRGATHFAGYIREFAIFFKPLAMKQLFRIPTYLLLNDDCEGVSLLGKQIEDLWSRIAESTSFYEQIQAVEEYLLPFAVERHSRSVIEKTADHIFQQKGILRIDQLAAQASMSFRTFERRFVEEIGIPPKLFARITRFQMVLDAKRNAPDGSWLHLAHEFGYFDQMHMIRDFRTLGGAAPGEVFRQGGDLQPWSLGTRDAEDSAKTLRRHVFDAEAKLRR